MLSLGRKEMAEVYLSQSFAYLEQAKEMVEKGDSRKASEALWGSIAEALLSLAVAKGLKPPTDHRSLKALARDIGIEAVKQAFKTAEKLHANYYHGFMDDEDVKEDLAIVEEGVRVLENMVKRSFKNL